MKQWARKFSQPPQYFVEPVQSSDTSTSRRLTALLWQTSWLLSLCSALQLSLPLAALIGQSVDILSACLSGVVITLFSAITFQLGERYKGRNIPWLGWLADVVLLAGITAGAGILIAPVFGQDATHTMASTTDHSAAGIALMISGLHLSLNLVHSGQHRLTLTLFIGLASLVTGAVIADSGHYLWVIAGYTISLTGCLIGLTETEATKPGKRIQWVSLPVMTLLLAISAYLWLPQPSPSLDTSWMQGTTTPTPSLYVDRDWLKEARDGAAQPSFIINQQQAPEPMPLEQWQTLYSDELNPQPSTLYNLFDYPGFNPQFSLPDVGQTRANHRLIALLQAKQGGYIKVRSFDRFDGVRWSQNRQSYTQSLTHAGAFALPQQPIGSGQPIAYRIELVATLPAAVPVLGHPINLVVPSPVVATDLFGQPALPAPLVAGTRWKGTSVITWSGTRPVSFGPKPSLADTELPTPFDHRLRLKALQLTKGQAKPRQQAKALETYLRQMATHLTTAQHLNRSTAQYLLEDQSGTPEQAATALVMMLRSIGIPSRLVTGFSTQHYNPTTGYFELTANHAHAWVEAWIENQWLVYEPSSMYQLAGPHTQPLLMRHHLSQYVDSNPGVEWVWLPFSLISTIAAMLLVLFFLIWLGVTLLNRQGHGSLRSSLPSWLRQLKGRWLMFRWERYIAPIIKPDTKKQSVTVPDFNQTLLTAVSMMQQMTEGSDLQRQPAELFEHWMERLWKEQVCRQSGPVHTDNTLTEQNLQTLAEWVNDYWYNPGQIHAKNQQELIALITALLNVLNQ